MEKGRYRIKDRAVGKLNLVLKLSHVRMYMCLFVNSGATMTKESKLSTRLENRQRVRSRGRETRWSWYVETTPIIRLNMLDWILSRERELIGYVYSCLWARSVGQVNYLLYILASNTLVFVASDVGWKTTLIRVEMGWDINTCLYKLSIER